MGRWYSSELNKQKSVPSYDYRSLPATSLLLLYTLLAHQVWYLFGFFVPVSPEFLAIFIHLTTGNLSMQNTPLLIMTSKIILLLQFSNDINGISSVRTDINKILRPGTFKQYQVKMTFP